MSAAQRQCQAVVVPSCSSFKNHLLHPPSRDDDVPSATSAANMAAVHHQPSLSYILRCLHVVFVLVSRGHAVRVLGSIIAQEPRIFKRRLRGPHRRREYGYEGLGVQLATRQGRRYGRTARADGTSDRVPLHAQGPQGPGRVCRRPGETT